jgi:hypothetical protein
MSAWSSDMPDLRFLHTGLPDPRQRYRLLAPSVEVFW